MDKIIKIIKRLVLAILLIYTYNKLSLPLNVVIPFNVITLATILVFDIPGFLLLILLSLV